jgi:hypothetical protein
MFYRSLIIFFLFPVLTLADDSGFVDGITPVQLPAGQASLQPFTASYQVYRGRSRIGVSTAELSADSDGLWVYKTRVSARGLARLFVRRDIVAESRFSVADNRPSPVLYVANGVKKNDRQRIVFDPALKTIASEYRGVEKNLEQASGTLDLLTLEIALMLQLSAGKTPALYTLVEKNRIQQYRFQIEDTEKVQTPFGELEAVRLRRQRVGSDKYAIIWLAPELNYLTVRFDKYKKEKIDFSLRLKRYRGPPSP